MITRPPRQKRLRLKNDTKRSMLTMRCRGCGVPCFSSSGRCWNCDAKIESKAKATNERRTA
jgi:hypothetical protein